MAQIKTCITGEVTIRKVFGDLTFDEIIRILTESYAGKPTIHVLWDLASASMAGMNYRDIDRLGVFLTKHDHLREGGKTAVVAPGALEFGLARTLDAVAEANNIKFATHAFRTFSEAAAWIGIDETFSCNGL